MNTLKFAVNTPARVALAFQTGKEVQGQFGPQVMFSLCLAPNGEHTMYVPPVVAEQITKLGIVKGEPFQVVKTETQNGTRKIEWKVTKLPPEPAKKPVQSQTTDHTPIPFLDPKLEWLRCADEAVDVLVSARAHAAAKGLPVQFSGEDVRVVASTLYIGRGQDRRFQAAR